MKKLLGAIVVAGILAAGTVLAQNANENENVSPDGGEMKSTYPALPLRCSAHIAEL